MRRGQRITARFLPALFTAVLMFGTTMAEALHLDCGAKAFLVTPSFLAPKIQQIKGENLVDYCVEDDPVSATSTVSFPGDEVWCVTLHHITPDSRPYAKSRMMLNYQSKFLYEYDYIWQNGAWNLTRKHRQACVDPDQPDISSGYLITQ
tara:strand:- start:223 stop:669 length:447 start_codon:yes stop_codon:yes gene_type:complete